MVKESQKKPYVKMRIEEVQLVPAEAVLGGCKTSSGDGILNVSDCFGDSCVGSNVNS